MNLLKYLGATVFIFVVGFSETYAQKKILIITPSKLQMFADRNPKKYLKYNRVSRDSVTGFVKTVFIKSTQMLEGADVMVVSANDDLSVFYEKLRTKKAKTISIDENKKVESKMDFIKKISRLFRKKNHKIKYRTLKQTPLVNTKLDELKAKYNYDFVVIVSRFEIDDKHRWNIAFRNRTKLELHYDILDKTNKKIFGYQDYEQTNLKDDMLFNVFLHYTDILTKHALQTINKKLKTIPE